MIRITRSRPRQIDVTVERQEDTMTISYGVIRETTDTSMAVLKDITSLQHPTEAIADSIRRFFGADNVSGLRVTHQQKQASNVDVYHVSCLVEDEEFLAG